jgi:hypothetical protein
MALFYQSERSMLVSAHSFVAANDVASGRGSRLSIFAPSRAIWVLRVILRVSNDPLANPATKLRISEPYFAMVSTDFLESEDAIMYASKQAGVVVYIVLYAIAEPVQLY